MKRPICNTQFGFIRPRIAAAICLVAVVAEVDVSAGELCLGERRHDVARAQLPPDPIVRLPARRSAWSHLEINVPERLQSLEVSLRGKSRDLNGKDVELAIRRLQEHSDVLYPQMTQSA